MAAQLTAQANTGGATATQQEPPVLTLRPQTLVLRGEETERRRIQWAEDVVDNENMGKKSSKGMLATSTIPIPSHPKD
jgi:protein phosphatase 1 regulatory subunit 11